MLTLCRASERRVESVAWSTFGRDPVAAVHAGGFFGLQTLVEVHLAPSAALSPIVHGDIDVVTYVHEGAVSFEDLVGHRGEIEVGEVHRHSSDVEARRTEANASSTSWARVFRVGLLATSRSASTDGPVRFTVGQRRNLGCVIASGDASAGGLRLRSDARIYSSVLDRGHHLVHTLAPARGAWIHIVAGEVMVNGVTVAQGDGAGVVMEPAMSVTALKPTELLLIDVDLSQGAGHGRSARGT